MKRLIRTVCWVGLVAAVLWLARALLKRWIDGPAVTPESGRWPARSAEPAASTSSAEVSGDESATSTENQAKSAGTSKQSSGTRRGRRVDRSDPGSWVIPNGSADVLLTYPVKAKLASRVYRVPGMPMYDRTVADRCYATTEAAEIDGFNRAAR